MTRRGDAGPAPSKHRDRFTRACPSRECRDAKCEPLKSEDIEMLACIAARLAGRHPDERTTIKLAGVVAFDDLTWRYPDFLARAEAAYSVLAGGCPTIG
jgi:hypothetical protein